MCYVHLIAVVFHIAHVYSGPPTLVKRQDYRVPTGTCTAAAWFGCHGLGYWACAHHHSVAYKSMSKLYYNVYYGISKGCFLREKGGEKSQPLK